MTFEDHLFSFVVRQVLDLVPIVVFGWALLYCLSKVGCYNGMMLGAIGCLGTIGLEVRRVALGLPEISAVAYPWIDTLRSQLRHFDGLVRSFWGIEIITAVTTVCLAAALAGRYRGEMTADDAAIDEVMGKV